MKKNKSRVLECTSSNFQGIISMMENDSSWVARWQRIPGTSFAKGVYAISVSGRIPNDILNDVERDNGKRYIPRDRSVTNE